MSGEHTSHKLAAEILLDKADASNFPLCLGNERSEICTTFAPPAKLFGRVLYAIWRNNVYYDVHRIFIALLFENVSLKRIYRVSLRLIDNNFETFVDNQEDRS